ncbi:MAG: hypothetical protein GYA00_00555 [Parcubacteria group bacterium]|nr:hypothetical protein [Parcubacteria group bacterium]
MVFEGSLIARSAPLARRSARIFPYISALNHTAGGNQTRFFCSAFGGSFQLFPQRFLFHKNLGTKQVFRRGERLLSTPAEVQSNCFPFAQNRLSFPEGRFWF